MTAVQLETVDSEGYYGDIPAAPCAPLKVKKCSAVCAEWILTVCTHAKKGSRSQLHFEPLDDYFTTFLGDLQCVHAFYAPDCT